MIISLIWAQDENGLIGAGGRLPWRLPADLAWFKKNTMGKPILMGRKTFNSIGKPLPNRNNIIITHADFEIEGCTVVCSLKEAIAAAGDAEELMVVGGAQVYSLALPQAGRLYITRIHAVFNGDTYFPELNTSEWRQTFREDYEADEINAYPYSFCILERAG